ncbi:hypothetical protein IE53DRAFT_392133 [Violaceomyces palustris]|uniref:Uncharacterized protein n=1 Tax=Violaceomyces palustris TaxID=1673888 RepID=A0ACD0P245_9BASI|nr:hypothetical protein IE53DRAFT_392133 [Violaceomyces palustris]
MSKSRSLPPALKQLIKSPLYPRRPSRSNPSRILPVGRSPDPLFPPKNEILSQLFSGIRNQADQLGLGWAEWLSLTTATLLTLNSPASLQALHRMAVGIDPSQSTPTGQPALNLTERTERACLMREVGLKCIGFIGIPKVINNLAALRAVVDEDQELASALPREPRRQISPERNPRVNEAAYALWDDIYTPHSSKLLKILGKSHPDLPIFIVESEYGPLFSSPSSFSLPNDPKHLSTEPSWEVNRLRTSLVAIAALRAQGGVGPQVTSHVWGLMKARDSIQPHDPNKKGLEWLTSEEGAIWVVKAVDGVSIISLQHRISGSQRKD